MCCSQFFANRLYAKTRVRKRPGRRAARRSIQDGRCDSTNFPLMTNAILAARLGGGFYTRLGWQMSRVIFENSCRRQVMRGRRRQSHSSDTACRTCVDLPSMSAIAFSICGTGLIPNINVPFGGCLHCMSKARQPSASGRQPMAVLPTRQTCAEGTPLPPFEQWYSSRPDDVPFRRTLSWCITRPSSAD
jgi:hypothetical protein